MKSRQIAKTIADNLRKTTFNEVQCAFSLEEAMLEAKRCLNCKSRACVSACPVNVKIPEFIQAITDNNCVEAYNIITETNLFPSICGRVCPQEKQCEGSCVLAKANNAISIGGLERFVSQFQTSSANKIVKKPTKVAIIGSGPAGLSCACDLLKAGYQVTIFEALHDFGGVLRYGIPEFRLPNSIIDDEIKKLKELGCQFIKNTLVGKTITINDLRTEGYCAFFVACGAGYPRFMNLPNEGSIGIFSANEFLTRVNLLNAQHSEYDTPLHIGKNVVVIGGGNVAIDAARCALRTGSEVTILYRREIVDMPARKEEVMHALEEGVHIIERVNPTGFLTNEFNQVNGISLVQMELVENSEDSRRNFSPIEDSEFLMKADTVIVAIGTMANRSLSASIPDLQLNAWGCIQVNEAMQSNFADIFAGGDIINGGATVIAALGDGKKAAENIINYLQKQ